MPSTNPTSPGLLGRIKNLLGSAFNLFAKGGATGGIIVRQPGGTPGVNEVQIYEDGTYAYIVPKQGILLIPNTNGAAIGASGLGGAFGGGFCSTSAIYCSSSGTGNPTAALSAGYCVVNSGGGLVFSPNNPISGPSDTGLLRAAAGVTRASAGASGAGWLQNTAGRPRNTADVTNATVTMANLSDLSVTLLAGRKYTGRLVLIANNSTGTEGLQFDCNGGTATFTSFEMTAEEAPIGATLGVTDSTAPGTALTNTVVSTGNVVYAINLTFVVNAGGTFIPRFAEVSHTAGTATVRLGSYLWLEDMPN